jgi:hypothetical protein
MDFDNLQSVSSVSDTLPYEAVSITGRAVCLIFNTK